MKKTFVLAVILNMTSCLFSCNGLSNRDYCYKILLKYEIPEHYNGIVDTIFIDEADHATPQFYIRNRKKGISLTYYPKDCYLAIQKGDSVVKQVDSLFILVYRQGNVIGKFYPGCYGAPEVREIDSTTIKRVTKKKWIEINPV